MKYVVLIPTLVLLTSCSSKPLTESECRALQDKELGYVSELLPPGDFPTLKSIGQDKADKGLAKCIAGNGYDRDDYECMMAANGWQETGKCIKAANSHIKP